MHPAPKAVGIVMRSTPVRSLVSSTCHGVDCVGGACDVGLGQTPIGNQLGSRTLGGLVAKLSQFRCRATDKRARDEVLEDAARRRGAGGRCGGEEVPPVPRGRSYDNAST
eukprot:scaffold71605_cov56-Phaeocystis_antarctica.AAC.2